MHILLVEDDEMLQKSLTYFLKAHSYTITSFNNGTEALEFLKDNHNNLDVVITDLNLPFAGGQQIIHNTRILQKSDIPIIVLTSSGVEATELEVFDLGADEFITKPFSPSILLKRLQKLVS